MHFKDFLAESFKKEYGYRIKIAANCDSSHMDTIEECLQKYNLVSVAAFKRRPISENPMEFVRTKGVKLISEVCSTDIVLKYPVNARILEVWLAVNLGIDTDRVIVYDVKDPRRLESDNAEERTEYNKDRVEEMDDAVLLNSDDGFEHYEMQNEEVDVEEYGFGEAYNKKFLDELKRIKAEKGSDYFRSYPSKDEIMGDNLRPTYDALMNQTHMGMAKEDAKEVHVIQQAGGAKA
jgi:hypothetical protein